ncbi:MAG: ABC transporter permease subunit [Candidatus Methanomethylophilaceae archaeon]|nr:ABC transporter permease subunit [Candidatus Methanomethylophilaceae archaeon]
MAATSFSDDIRLAGVIMKNEFLKQRRGKRLLIFGIITAMILVFITAALAVVDNDIVESPRAFCRLFLGILTLFVIIGSTLFGATTVVSEFEERTALILFNRPIEKWSIYVGKFVAAFLIVSAYVVIYYVFVMIASMILAGGIADGMGMSLVCSLFYVFGTVGVAIMFSSLMKKSATASIITFFALFLLFDLVVSIVAVIAGFDDTWYMINSASSSIVDVLDPSADVQVLRDILVMFVWGLVPAIIGFIRFRNKDF